MAGQVPPARLSPNLTIGVDDGDEKLLLGMIVRVDVDGRGNIYILDYKFSRVGVFDQKGDLLRQIAVPEGQGPRETTGMPGIAVTPGGTLFINDARKVIVYGPDGRYVRTFPSGFAITSIGCPGTEELVVLGPHEGKLLHVFDERGRRVASFGDLFAPPQKYEQIKEVSVFRSPLRFSCAKDGRVFVMSPHRYEVSVFKDRKLEGVIEGRNDAFVPVRKTSFGFASPVAEVWPSGDLVLVALLTRVPSPTVSVPRFGPRVLNTCVGLRSWLAASSPKSQRHEVGAPVDASVNRTAWPSAGRRGLKVKLALRSGAESGEVRAAVRANRTARAPPVRARAMKSCPDPTLMTCVPAEDTMQPRPIQAC